MNQDTASYLFNNPTKLMSFKRYKRDEYNEVVEQTNFLPKDTPLKARLWHIMNEVQYVITCKMCDNPVKWDIAARSSDQKYRSYCSHACLSNDPEFHKNRIATMHKKYGHGLADIVSKIQKTNLKKYGHKSAMATDEIKQKRNATCIDRYGVDNPAKVERFIVNRKQTTLERFGVEHAAQSTICKERAKNTYLRKYGIDHISHRNMSADTYDKLNDKTWLINEHHVKQHTLSKIADNLNITLSALCRYYHKNNIIIKNFHHSMGERELIDFIKSLNIKCITNTRDIISPYELDIYLPEYNIAIEFNGNYWHSELLGKDKKYHLTKTIHCADKNIQLIHIFESEWIQKTDIIKSRLSSILGKNERIYARKCKVVTITSHESAVFLNDTHIQGNVNAKINYGLKYNGTLVAVMTFGTSRFSKKSQYELIRFSTIQNVNVIGGAGKLLKYFIQQHSPLSIVSYCDLRFSTGKLYKTLGFVFSHNSEPNCYYFHNNNTLRLYSRIKFQKHKLNKELKHFNPALTAWENMIDNDYNRIWDCGNGVWHWTA